MGQHDLVNVRVTYKSSPPNQWRAECVCGKVFDAKKDVEAFKLYKKHKKTRKED